MQLIHITHTWIIHTAQQDDTTITGEWEDEAMPDDTQDEADDNRAIVNEESIVQEILLN